ncbi:MAG: ABC transporter permease [Chloroflexi bacterium]|nr:ABC transporter permease [Chloroflexota bacterium]
MLPYILRRLLWAPVVLLVVTLVTFALGVYGPGDPITLRLGQHANPEVAARLRHELGLDRPFLVQYRDYMGGILQGNLGESLVFRGRSVVSLLLPRVWISLQLGLAAIAISVGLGIPLGLVSALRQGNWRDTTIVSGALLFYVMPAFILAPILLYAISFRLHWLPSSGWGGLWDGRVLMPALVLGLPGIAGITRLMRASTLDVIGQDYVRTARSKGLLPRRINYVHIGRNAVLPVVTVVGLSLATLVEGAFITETIFGIPGVGRLAVESLFNRDYPVIMALTLMVAVGYVLVNLAVDIAYSILDPRIRYR